MSVRSKGIRRTISRWCLTHPIVTPGAPSATCGIPGAHYLVTLRFPRTNARLKVTLPSSTTRGCVDLLTVTCQFSPLGKLAGQLTGRVLSDYTFYRCAMNRDDQLISRNLSLVDPQNSLPHRPPSSITLSSNPP